MSTFSVALIDLKAGRRIARECWDGRIFISFQDGELVSENLDTGKRVPYIILDEDLLASDWGEVAGGGK